VTRRVVLVTGDATNQATTCPAHAWQPRRGTGEHGVTVTGLRAIHSFISLAPPGRTLERSQAGNRKLPDPTRWALRHARHATAARDHRWLLLEETHHDR